MIRRPAEELDWCATKQRTGQDACDTRTVDDGQTTTCVVICDPGDEAVASLSEVARREKLRSAQISAIGAFSSATVGWLDPRSWEYQPIAVNEQCEALSLLGDVADDENGNPILHLHAVLGLSDGTTRGGHLISGRVNPTLEVILREPPEQLRKVTRAGIPIPTIDVDRSGR